MRTVVVGLLVLGVVVGAVLGWWWLVGVAAVLLAVALYDVLQRTHAVLRNYPVLGHLRFLLERVRPELQQYFIERNFDGRPYDRDTRTIDLRAREGHQGRARRSAPSATSTRSATSTSCTPPRR